MSDNLHFSIEFYKNFGKPLTVDEQREAAEKSLFITEALVYALTEAAIYTELSSDDKLAHFGQIREVINKFISSALANVYEIEKNRKALEKAETVPSNEFSQNLTSPDD